MKNKNEFFHEETPLGHAEKIQAAVQDSLRRNQVLAASEAKEKSKTRRFWLLGFPATALIGIFAFRFFYQANKQESSELLAFADLFESEDVTPVIVTGKQIGRAHV